MDKNNLVNYEYKSSNTNNYSQFTTSSSPESFPNIAGNGIFVEYKLLNPLAEIVKPEEPKNNSTDKKK